MDDLHEGSNVLFLRNPLSSDAFRILKVLRYEYWCLGNQKQEL